MSTFYPLEGWHISGIELGFYQTKDLLPDIPKKLEPISNREVAEPIRSCDSLVLQVEKDSVTDSKPVLIKTFQYNNINQFSGVFSALDSLENNQSGRVRIIHYGDSQIEGDRISSYIRNQLQATYGGGGFGYTSLKPLVPPSAIKISENQGLVRRTAYGRRDSSIQDMSYGFLASFTSLEKNKEGLYWGKFEFEHHHWGFRRSKTYDLMRLSVGMAMDTIHINIDKPSGDTSLTIEPKSETQHVSVNLMSGELFQMKLESDSSVRIYGMSLETRKGVQLDNVAMRGASGTFFSRLDEEQFKEQLQNEGYSLIILQYGGNVVPYVKDSMQIVRYAKSIGRQIQLFQSILPEATVIYIGPGDMSRKSGVNFVSWEVLTPLKTLLREEVLEKNAIYWDLYDVMGGENSMVQWVNLDPPLAVKDYVHFTPAGARFVGEQFMKCFMSAYESWKSQQE